MRILIILFVSLLLVVCISSQTKPLPSHIILCIDGVEYINVFPHQMAPHFKPDGSLYACEEVSK